jgi:hypothetical protein
MRSTRNILVALVALLACGCSKETAPVRRETPGAGGLSERFHLAQPPASARGVAEIKRDAKTGDRVVVTGRVGGSTNAFLDGLAVFTLVDHAMKACDVDSTDDCPTPWDYCCTPPEQLARHVLTVEFTEGDRPLRASVRGFHGLEHATTVTVEGVVRKDDAGNVSVITSGLYVHPK